MGLRDSVQSGDHYSLLNEDKLKCVAGGMSPEAYDLTVELGELLKYILETSHEDFDEDKTRDRLNECFDVWLELKPKEIINLAEAIIMQSDLPNEAKRMVVGNLLFRLLSSFGYDFNS